MNRSIQLRWIDLGRARQMGKEDVCMCVCVTVRLNSMRASLLSPSVVWWRWRRFITVKRCTNMLSDPAPSLLSGEPVIEIWIHWNAPCHTDFWFILLWRETIWRQRDTLTPLVTAKLGRIVFPRKRQFSSFCGNRRAKNYLKLEEATLSTFPWPQVTSGKSATANVSLHPVTDEYFDAATWMLHQIVLSFANDDLSSCRIAKSTEGDAELHIQRAQASQPRRQSAI